MSISHSFRTIISAVSVGTLVLARTVSADPFSGDFTQADGDGDGDVAVVADVESESAEGSGGSAELAGETAAESAGVATVASVNDDDGRDTQVSTQSAGVAPESVTSETTADGDVVAGSISGNYFGILYGPSLSRPNSRYQPDAQGQTNFERPVELKNWAGVSYHFTDEVSITPTLYFTDTLINGQGFTMGDPFVRFTHSSIFSYESFNIFADARIHFPVSSETRAADQLVAFQFREILGWAIPQSRWEVGLANSQWLRKFGGRGYGDDLTLYMAPYAMFQVSPTVAASFLYEMQAAHVYGADAFDLVNDGTDFEPGISWDITRNVNFNPYLNIYTGDRITWKSTSVGANLSVKLF